MSRAVLSRPPIGLKAPELVNGSSTGFDVGDVPAQRLDHVLAGSALRIEAVRVPAGGTSWAMLSDHLPIVADLVLDVPS